MSMAKNGAMAAILNCPEEKVKQILEDSELTTIDIANLNAPTQIVISGLKSDIHKAKQFFEKAKSMFIPLKTSGAFHSRYMKEAGKEFEQFIRKTQFSKARFPVIANINARPYSDAVVNENLTNQIFSCVRWSETITYLLDKGDMEFEELGVGDVLTKLQRYIKKGYNTRKKIENTKTG